MRCGRKRPDSAESQKLPRRLTGEFCIRDGFRRLFFYTRKAVPFPQIKKTECSLTLTP